MFIIDVVLFGFFVSNNTKPEMAFKAFSYSWSKYRLCTALLKAVELFASLLDGVW